MVSNACLVHKLSHTVVRLQLHTELRNVLFGASSAVAAQVLPSCMPYDVLKFLALWDYERSLSLEVKYLGLGVWLRLPDRCISPASFMC